MQPWSLIQIDPDKKLHEQVKGERTISITGRCSVWWRQQSLIFSRGENLTTRAGEETPSWVYGYSLYMQYTLFVLK